MPRWSRDGQVVHTHTHERTWPPVAAFAFVLLAIVALAVAPALLLQRITATTGEFTSTLIPAYQGVRNVAFAMEERIASSRSRFLTGDPIHARRLERARADEAAALRAIELLAPRLSPASVRHVHGLQRLVARRDSLEASVLATGEDLQTYLAAIPRFDALRDTMSAQLAELNREVVRVTESRIAEEARWAGVQRALSIGLGAVAVVAVLVVGWFARRQRTLGRELRQALLDANRQREIAERHGEEVVRATDARARLLRGFTHDVKNPLGAARGYVDLLKMEVRAPVLPEQRPLLDGIQRSVDGALAIIADLLDLARSDSEGLRVERVETDLAAVTTAAAEDHRSAAETAGHTLEVVAPAEPLSVYTDPDLVAQVLGNLLSNAVKYTPSPGRITVRCGIESGAGGGRWATVEVSDTGPGIPPGERDRIFEEFTRLDERGPRKGHGLGLAIARRVARLLGGEITVEEADEGGAAFILHLPLRSEAAADGDDHLGGSPPAGTRGGADDGGT
jgi:signal transduction histidine kinase